MAVTFDATANGFADAATSLTFSHTVAAGSDRLIDVGVSAYVGGGVTVSDVTYAGTGMTQIADQNDAGAERKAHARRLVAPATGANNVVITMSSATDIISGSRSYQGVDPGTPIGNVQQAAFDATSTSLTVTGVTSDDIVADVWSGSGGITYSVTAGADQTQRWARQQSADDVSGGGSTQPGSAGGVMSWTFGATVSGAQIAHAVKAATAAAKTPYYPWLQRAPTLAQ